MQTPLQIRRQICSGAKTGPFESRMNMAACGTCHPGLTPNMPALLFEIRHGFRAEWNGLSFVVETDSGDWTLQIRDSATRNTLYTARRPHARAAQHAAAEYAAFFAGGPVNPDRLAQQLSWQEYW
jgi:hypothetical protein